jgi:hypothetical protein
MFYNGAFSNVSKYDIDDQNLLLATVQWPAKKVSHHLNVSVKKALITHLDFDVTQK